MGNGCGGGVRAQVSQGPEAIVTKSQQEERSLLEAEELQVKDVEATGELPVASTPKAVVTFPDIGLMVPRLLLPRSDVDLTKWCVIACDQYTSEPEYWQRVTDFVGDAPSMLNLIYPEVYLPQKRDAEIIEHTSQMMQEYMNTGILEAQEPGFVLIDRRTPSVASRKGLLVALDLEHYSFEQGSQSLIRATEKTIEARLPPRIAIRQKALIESPHILVLIDDPERTVLEPLFNETSAMRKLYDFDLMEGSGHLTGFHVSAKEQIVSVVDALRKLSSEERFRERYGAHDGQGKILFAIGDGNHSLATAKRCWEALKSQGAANDHPARYALVELNNVHDEGLEFHPIHRLVEKVHPEEMAKDLEAFFAAQGHEIEFKADGSMADAAEAATSHHFVFCSQQKTGLYSIKSPKMVLDVATLDSWLNSYVSAHGSELDYVHEEATIRRKSMEDGTAGFLLPAMNKADLVKTVVQEGVLPRKTFSMGHAPEKRFYFECRAVVQDLTGA